MMKKTDVKEHPRQTKTGRTKVRKHERTIKQNRLSISNTMKNRKVSLDGSYSDLSEIQQQYVKEGYKEPAPGMTLKKGADQEYIIARDNGSREHHRIYEYDDRFEIESHIDVIDPGKNPIGHFTNDVLDPELYPALREQNFNDTQIVVIKKL